MYFVRRIPFIGRHITPHVYRYRPLKKFLTVVCAIFRFLMHLFFGGLTFLIALLGMLFYSDFILKRDIAGSTSTVLIWLILISLVELMPRKYLIENDALTLIDNFHLDQKNTIQALTLGVSLRKNLTASLIPLLLIGLIVQNFWLVVASTGAYAFLLAWNQASSRFWWQLQNKNKLPIILYALIVYLTPLGLVLFGQLENLATSLFSPLGALISWLLAVLCVIYWLKFPAETQFISHMNQMKNKGIQLKLDDTDQYFANGLNLEKSLRLEPTMQISKKSSGNNYLNSLLFARFRPELNKMLKLRLLSIAGAGVLILVSLVVFNRIHLLGTIKEEQLTNIYGMLFFLCYLASFGRPIVQLLFVNCDAAMLYYPFYRQPKAILKGFFFRFRQTILYNGIISGLIFILFLGLLIVPAIKVSVLFYFVLALELAGLTLFFSFHELFIYYLLQPFTSDLKVVSPLYKIIDGAMYWISYLFLREHFSGYGYAIFIAVFTLGYVSIGTMLIYFLAPKKFRIRA
ncbi:ABC transporter ATP-binding protein [Xylocopilactobacillus apicola]|uniref:ABC transporter ATP-binding protein n=1 Tax=Xylocopilactobacillus apicola TaxID=2932184 RepID=UPI0029558D4C|nr:ABC transporter ATP-binding protein [Xylocopilactobacillus apicola]